MTIGTCKLTGDKGPLVKAHVLPKALTYGAEKGLPFAQSGRDHPPIKRWDSWYDPSIVTQKGEDILEAYDQWAIVELRKHALVWSSWGAENNYPSDIVEIPDAGGWGVRILKGIDGGRLRLFFLSLLWRAAVSDMLEFREIEVRASDIRRLRNMVRDGDPKPLFRFPIALIQLSTKGAIHNLAPLSQRKPMRPWDKNSPSEPIFRFYFDGLIAHIHRESTKSKVDQLSNMFIGNGDDFVVSTVPFENSWQRDNLVELMREAQTRWPERLARIPGFSTESGEMYRKLPRPFKDRSEQG